MYHIWVSHHTPTAQMQSRKVMLFFGIVYPARDYMRSVRLNFRDVFVSSHKNTLDSLIIVLVN